MEEKKEKFGGVLTAKMLSNELGGSFKERIEAEKSILIKMSAGAKPEVTFTGFWNGRLIKLAMNSIAKGYRLRRHEVTYARKVEANKLVEESNKEEGDGKKA